MNCSIPHCSKYLVPVPLTLAEVKNKYSDEEKEMSAEKLGPEVLEFIIFQIRKK